MSEYRIAIDVGGTFTDFVVSEPGVADRPYKQSSTPSDPAIAVVNGLETVATDLGLSLDEFLARTPMILHGTTITTNALLTRRGARTGLLATAGFRDTLGLRQGHREDQWDSKAAPPIDLIPRHLVREVAGRINSRGEEATPLREDDVVVAAKAFAAGGVEAVAVSLLFSFINQAHESRVKEILEATAPGTFVSLSSAVAPHVGLYERTSTTAVNAYVGPILRAYLADLRQRLAEVGFAGSLQVMQSNGGLAGADTVARNAVTTLLSGPAGGPIASATVVEPIGIPKTMTIDMGGTSFEASLARGGDTEIRVDGLLAGYKITTPALDISTIGAGGGSIAWIDSGGMLRVGPLSAGAQPGPACYGRGGEEATVTDANLLLGYVGASSFGSGELALDGEAAERAVGKIADRLGIGLHEAAAGIVTTINAAMADSLRLMSLRRGLDAREFALVAAGGAGPVHAAALADDLEIPLVAIPRDASVHCAVGIGVTDFRHDYIRTLFGRGFTPAEIEATFRELEAEAAEELEREGVPAGSMSYRWIVEVRYLGQIHAIDLELPAAEPISEATMETLKESFHPAHYRRFGHSLVDNEIELVNARLEARGSIYERTGSPEAGGSASTEGPVPTHSRPAWFGAGFVETPVYDPSALAPGAVIEGPAMVELETSTVVVPPERRLEVHDSGALLLHSASFELGALVERLYAGGASA
jgi:N-methylhydantoinase A